MGVFLAVFVTRVRFTSAWHQRLPPSLVPEGGQMWWSNKTDRADAAYSMVQPTAWCSLQHGAAYSMVQTTAWCRLQHGAAYSMVQPTAWCRLQHGAAYSMVQSTAWCSLQHGAVYSMVQTTAWCSLQHGADYSMVQPTAWCSLQQYLFICNTRTKTFYFATFQMTVDLTHGYKIQSAAILKLNLHTEPLEERAKGRKHETKKK